MAQEEPGPISFGALLAMQEAGPGRWAASAAPATDEPRLFGGLLIAQAIAAASAGTRRCHALHAFYIGVGATTQPFELRIDTMRDGGSFATRRAEVWQGERLLLAGITSHHDGDAGSDVHAAMPGPAAAR